MNVECPDARPESTADTSVAYDGSAYNASQVS